MSSLVSKPRPPFRARPATRGDVPAIVAIYNDAVIHTTASYDYEPRPLEHRMAWFEDHEKSGHAVFVACDVDGAVVGWSALNRFHDRMGYRFTSENSVYVAPACQGQGVGSLLLEPLIGAAERRGLRSIIAVIDASNAASIRLHARFGFEQVGFFKQVGYKFDRWLDVVYMQRLLPVPSSMAT